MPGITQFISSEHYYATFLKDEPKAFMTACAQAEKAADYLRAYQ